MTASTPASDIGRLQILDPIRGFAALWVFTFHWHFSEQTQNVLGPLHHLLKAGDRAVPLFFVISGYCLSASLSAALRRNGSPIGFMARRAWRIYPTFWCSVLLILCLRSAMSFIDPSDIRFRFPSYDEGDWAGVLSLTQIFDSSPGLWWTRFGAINGAYWTLGIEMQFYAFVAVALCFGGRARAFLTGLTAFAFFTYFWTPLFGQVAGRGIAVAFWPWFACGLAVHAGAERGILPNRLLGHHWKTISISLASLLFGCGIVCGLLQQPIERLVFSVGAAITIWCLIPFDAAIQQIAAKSLPTRLTMKFSLVLGTASYSLYLIHNEVAAFVHASGRFVTKLGFEGITLDIAIVAATVIVALGFSYVFERPFLQMALRRSKAARSGSSQVKAPVLPFSSNVSFVRPTLMDESSRAA